MSNEHQPVEAAFADFGVGDQVIVRHDSRDGIRDWVGEPSGEIVSSAGADEGWELVVGQMGVDHAWVVSFDEPQYLKDGSGPFGKTTVAAWRLVPAPLSYADEPVDVPAS